MLVIMLSLEFENYVSSFLKGLRRILTEIYLLDLDKTVLIATNHLLPLTLAVNDRFNYIGEQGTIRTIAFFRFWMHYNGFPGLNTRDIKSHFSRKNCTIGRTAH